MVLQSNNNPKFPEWDLSEDLLSEGVEANKPMEISCLSKNMEEFCSNKSILRNKRKQGKTLKQDIRDMLRIIVNRKKYLREIKVKANSCDLGKNAVNQEYFDNRNGCEEIKYITMKDLPYVSNI